MKGYVELPNAREVRPPTEKAVLLEYGEGAKKQGWFPKKTIAYEGGKTFVAIWFNKKLDSTWTKPPTKTELVNKFEKKRLIQVQGDNVECLIKAGEYVIQSYADYRKGSPNSGSVLTNALDELSHWIEENKKDKKDATKALDKIGDVNEIH
jgi:hypothetical protein